MPACLRQISTSRARSPAPCPTVRNRNRGRSRRVFSPVFVGRRMLVDGGLVNPVPVNVARAMGAEAEPAHYPEEEAYIDEQAKGLTAAEALARVAAVDEVRELLEHNIRDASVLPRLARAFSKPVA